MDTLFDLPEISKARHAIRLMNGSKSKNKRREHDFYPTPEIATVILLEREKFVGEVWECACGDGAMSKVIERYGYPCKSTDLIDRGFGESGVDFLHSTYRTDNIMTNPPFKLGNQFIHQALTHASKKIALLLRLNYLETQTLKKFFVKCPFARLYVCSERIPFVSNDGKTDNAIAFGWFIWDYSFKGKPTIEWI